MESKYTLGYNVHVSLVLGEGAKNNDVFNLSRDAISAKQKVLKKQGKGNKPKKDPALSVQFYAVRGFHFLALKTV
jgi:hypothetical protein